MGKKIFIAVGITLIAAFIVLGVLLLVRPNQDQAAAPAPDPSSLVLDTSKDYGACRIVDVATIKTALGTAANSLQDPQNLGITSEKLVGEGVEDIISDAQTCVFRFVTGGTLENSYNVSNALSVYAVVYTNSSGPEPLIEQIKNDPTTVAVEEVATTAFYTSNTFAQGPGAVYSFSLQVFEENKSTSYIIRQPADAATFTAETAKTALIALATSAE